MARGAPRYDSLIHAIREGTADDVRRFLAAGADPNEVDEVGDVTPLTYAAERGDLGVVRALVEAGADVDALAEDFSGDSDRFECLDAAFQNGELDGLTALVYATLHGHAEVVRYLAGRTAARLRSQAEGLARRARETPGA
jgi:ankyrin repeat protein